MEDEFLPLRLFLAREVVAGAVNAAIARLRVRLRLAKSECRRLRALELLLEHLAVTSERAEFHGERLPSARAERDRAWGAYRALRRPCRLARMEQNVCYGLPSTASWAALPPAARDPGSGPCLSMAL